ncbi:MAG: hypothetical protein NZZ41_01075 [Candidatus Dojkabacteria bacterium]|nr:hypothetical protein [Candidatus Dojkabacteria bacterium]
MKSYDVVNKVVYGVGIIRLEDLSKDYSEIDFFSNRLESETILIKIYDNIESYFRVAEMYLTDRYCLREYMPLTGNEIISIRYRNSSHDPSVPEKIYHFFIVNIQEEQNTTERDRGSTILKLSLVEAPIYYFLTTNSIYKTYKWDGGSKEKAPEKEKTIYDIMIDTFSLIPHITKWYDFDIEETLEDLKINFYIPNWTPYKTLNYLRKFAINKENFPYFVCYVEPPEKIGKKPKIILKSIYSLMKKKGVHLFANQYANQTYRPPNSAQNPLDNLEEEKSDFDMTNVYNKRYFFYFNRTKTLFSKMSGETFFTFDYIHENKYIAYDFNDFRKKYRGLGQHFIHSMVYGNQWSKFRPHSFTEPKQLVSMKINEYAHQTLHSAISCMLFMPVNENRRIGQLADILIKNPMKDINIDLLFSGKWLIWGQIDILSVTFGDASSIVYCLKDGFERMSSDKGFVKMEHLQPPNNS